MADAVKVDGNGYEVVFNVGGNITRVHTSAELPTWFVPINGSIVGGIYEKAEAYFRSGENTYASLNYGWPSEAAYSLNVPSVDFSTYTQSATQLTAWIQNAVAIHEAVVIYTSPSATSLVPNHCYSLSGITTDANGTLWVSLRNPWGFDDATITVDTLIAQCPNIFYTP